MISVGKHTLEQKEYNVYIDESGDEGINKGSKYFILTAVIVSKDKDLKISKEVDNIKENLEMKKERQLHWVDIKGFPNKKMIMEKTSKLDIKIINIVIDTSSIKFLPSKDIYLFFSGYLYERICWLMKERNGVANIIISSRSNLSKEKLLEYIKDKNHEKFTIDSNKIKDIKIVPNADKKLLQLTDSCCSSLYQALDKNDKKYFEIFATIQDKLYSKKKNTASYGLKLVPNLAEAVEYNNLLRYLNK